MYKLNPAHPLFGESKSVIRTTDSAVIPFDPDNTDYQKYLAWVAEGNTVLPADEVSGE